MTRICVIGTGYVGLVTGACFADLGNTVVCLDNNAAKVDKLVSGVMPIFEPGLAEVVERNVAAGRLSFTTDYALAVPSATFIFIAVNTPSDSDGAAEMRYVRAAAASIAEHLSTPAVIVNKSTVPIGTGDLVTEIVAAHAPRGTAFAVVSNPEFLREGSAVSDFLHPDRVVLGSTSARAAEEVAELYAPLQCPTIITDLRTAEMIKYASNAFLATRVSFINEIAHICERLGADVKQVALGMGCDKRIGRGFLDAGVGYGGSCFPKDVRALAHMAETCDCHPQLLHAVMDINRDQRRLFVDKLAQILGSLEGTTVAVLGLSFKPDTDDMREAPSIDIVRLLQSMGARVRAYDPVASEVAKDLLPGIELTGSPYEAAAGADALLVITEWNEFKQLDMRRVFALMRRPILLDGRNIYDPAELRALGFDYRGVGRGYAVDSSA